MGDDARTEAAGRREPPRHLTDEPSGRWGRWSVLLPALTFLAGLLLGAAVLGATRSDDGTPPPRAAPSAVPTPSPSPSDALVRVPGPCLQAAEQAEQAYALVEQGVAAARELDARGLADLVDEVQRRRPEVQALLEACRTAASRGIVEPAPTG